MDSLYGHCITVCQAPFRCVGLWATHSAMEMLSPRSSPQGGLSLLRKPSPHICVTVAYSRSHAADILAVWRGSSDSVGEAHLGALPGGSDPWADSGRTSMSHFNFSNKGIRKEARTGKSPWGPESYLTSHLGLEVYGLKHRLPFLWGSCVFPFLPLSAQEYLRRRGKTAGLTSSLTPSFLFRTVPLRRPRWTGCFPHLGRPCCLFPRGRHVRGQGSLAAVTLPHVCVVAASLSNSVALTPCPCPLRSGREHSDGRTAAMLECEAASGPCSVSEIPTCLGPPSPNIPGHLLFLLGNTLVPKHTCMLFLPSPECKSLLWVPG